MDDNQNAEEQLTINKTTPFQEEVPQKSKGSKKIIWFYLFGAIVFLIIGIVGIKIYKNSLQSITKNQSKVITTTATVLPTQKQIRPAPTAGPHLIVNKPTVDLKTATVATDGGNVYLISGDKKELLINTQANKNYLREFPVDMYFTQAELSPDKSKMFACGYAGISHPVLFYINFGDNNNSHQVDTCTEASWSSDSRYIAFTNSFGDCGPDNTNVGFYDTKADKTYYLATFNHLPTIPNLNFKTILYDTLKWQPDSSAISAHYTAYLADEGCMMGTGTKPVGEGTVTFPLSKHFSVNF